MKRLSVPFAVYEEISDPRKGIWMCVSQRVGQCVIVGLVLRPLNRPGVDRAKTMPTPFMTKLGVN